MNQFLDEISSKIFSNFSKKSFYNKKIKLFSHIDTDGICSAFLFEQILKQLNFFLEVKYISYCDVEKIKENFENKNLYIFLDLGSVLFEDNFFRKKKNIFVFDHHKIKAKPHKNLFNPFHFGYDGSKEVCSSTLIFLFGWYFFGTSFGKYSSISFLGVYGDRQKDEIIGINKEILDFSIKNKYLSIEIDLSFFGRKSRKICSFLYYGLNLVDRISYLDFYEFLKKSINLAPFILKSILWIDLSFQDRKKIEDLIYEKFNLSLSNFKGRRYLFPFQEPEAYSELDFFSTTINSLGRNSQYFLAKEILKRNFSSEILEKIEIYRNLYSKKIRKFFKYIQKNKFTKIEKKKYEIIFTNDNFSLSIIGVLASLYSRFKAVLIIGFDDEIIKGSFRGIEGIISFEEFIFPFQNKFYFISQGGHHSVGGFILKKVFYNFLLKFINEDL